MATINLADTDDNYVGTTGNDNIYGNGGSDTIDGGDGNDNLRGGEGEDSLIGGSGNDFLDGGADADRMFGGTGNDTYIVDDRGDAVVEYAGEGLDLVRSYIFEYRLGANLEGLQLIGDVAKNGVRNDLNNTITGNVLGNSLRGLGGNDTIAAGDGNDTISGDGGNDAIDGGTGVDIATYRFDAAGVTVDLSITGNQNTGGSGIDRLTNIENLEGSQFNDILSGNSGANVISALGGDDVLRGREGNDTLESGTGSDTFRFEGTATNGYDIIRNFASTSDTLEFRVADGYSASATITIGAGATATSAGPEFIFDSTSNLLSYDEDGTGAGAATVLAGFVNGDVMTSSDFIII